MPKPKMVKVKDVLAEIKKAVDIEKKNLAAISFPTLTQKDQSRKRVAGLKAAAAVVRGMTPSE